MLTDTEIIRDTINAQAEEGHNALRGLAKRKKEPRSEGWETVARHAIDHGIDRAYRDYCEDFFAGVNRLTAIMRNG